MISDLNIISFCTFKLLEVNNCVTCLLITRVKREKTKQNEERRKRFWKYCLLFETTSKINMWRIVWKPFENDLDANLYKCKVINRKIIKCNVTYKQIKTNRRDYTYLLYYNTTLRLFYYGLVQLLQLCYVNLNIVNCIIRQLHVKLWLVEITLYTREVSYI